MNRIPNYHNFTRRHALGERSPQYRSERLRRRRVAAAQRALARRARYRVSKTYMEFSPLGRPVWVVHHCGISTRGNNRTKAIKEAKRLVKNLKGGE